MPRSEGPLVSVIDLGTNTALMVTGRRCPDGTIEVVDDAHAIARLGKGVDAQRRIPPETAARVCGLLAHYRDRARSLGAAQIAVYGTSALRDASNKEEFITRVRQEVGIELRVVSGADEARLTFVGAGFGLALPDRYGVVDLGGGSTELAVGADGRIAPSQSVDVGAVRITERFFPCFPPPQAQQEAARIAIRHLLGQFFPYPPDVPLVGVAGTVTTLGAIDRGLERFDAEELNGHFLEAARVDELSDLLLGLSIEEIQAIPQVEEQRADIIAAGALILRLALRQWGCQGVLVSTRGIRYGLLLQTLGA
jgi:exopolyphosphatase / guanosine-5'-triphosphate,3'-diphosphate pyrophosphatase